MGQVKKYYISFSLNTTNQVYRNIIKSFLIYEYRRASITNLQCVIVTTLTLYIVSIHMYPSKTLSTPKVSWGNHS